MEGLFHVPRSTLLIERQHAHAVPSGARTVGEGGASSSTAIATTIDYSLEGSLEADLAALMAKAVSAMQATVADKLTLFGSTGKA